MKHLAFWDFDERFFFLSSGALFRLFAVLWLDSLLALFEFIVLLLFFFALSFGFPQLMVFQMQFLSMLRLLEANISAPFMQLLNNLKWLNLHFDTGLGSWLTCGKDVRGGVSQFSVYILYRT